MSSYARSNFLAELSDGAIDVLAARAASPSPIMTLFFMEHLHGRASAIRPADSAFSYRKPGHNFAVLSMWFEPGQGEAAAAHVRSFFDDMSPFLAQDVYSNYLGEEGDARVKAAYGAAWAGLVQLKRKYDPDNVFRLNQNVNPAA